MKFSLEKITIFLQKQKFKSETRKKNNIGKMIKDERTGKKFSEAFVVIYMILNLDFKIIVKKKILILFSRFSCFYLAE